MLNAGIGGNRLLSGKHPEFGYNILARFNRGRPDALRRDPCRGDGEDQRHQQRA